MTDTFLTTLNKTNAALTHIESGKGVLGKLIYDDKYGEELTTSVTSAASSLKSVAENVQHSLDSGEGVLPALLKDPEGKKKVYELVDNLRTTSSNLSDFSTNMKNGQGLLPRLINDKAYGDQALAEFTGLVRQLNDTVAKINAGQGTAGKIISDPSVYESINDILIGINESKLLRWLIRNRQQTGIEKRYKEEQKTAPAQPVSDVKTSITPAQPSSPPPEVPVVTTTASPPPKP